LAVAVEENPLPEFHAEPFLHLAGLSHDRALVTWGAFYFRVRSSRQWKLVDDSDLKFVHPPRRETIGARSEPYGPAVVRVYDADGRLACETSTLATNWCWVSGLSPDTTYRYEVTVKDETWGRDERWDWRPGHQQGLLQDGGRYENVFRTFPDPKAPLTTPFSFAVIGDFGTGIKKPSTRTRRQREVATALAQAAAAFDVRFVVTTGDNIYAGNRLFGLPVGQQGDEDDDWYFTFFQPYRYLLNRIPFYPSIGNHDAAESEDRDDRAQVLDNLYIQERFGPDQLLGRASLAPGLFYRFRYGRDVEFVCVDTSKEDFFGKRLFEYPDHRAFLESTFTGTDAARWTIPFGHHPRYCAGPRHRNTDGMESLDPLLARAGVRVMLAGHEHNFQQSAAHGIDFFVTGAGSKVRTDPPRHFADAHTVSWSSSAHFLLITIDGDTMRVRPYGELVNGELREIERYAPDGGLVNEPIVIRR
jgi:tartrate-resistant acid phosphatase type 5